MEGYYLPVPSVNITDNSASYIPSYIYIYKKKLLKVKRKPQAEVLTFGAYMFESLQSNSLMKALSTIYIYIYIYI